MAIKSKHKIFLISTIQSKSSIEVIDSFRETGMEVRVYDESSPDSLNNRNILEEIHRYDAMYLSVGNGEISKEIFLLIGAGSVLNIPIYISNESHDKALTPYVTKVASPIEVYEELHSLPIKISDNSPVHRYQKYLSRMVDERGFSDETITQTLLLMIEEVGELAKGIRKYSGLKVDKSISDEYHNLQDEIADVFIYLLIIANKSNIDISTAFIDKEEKNKKREWVKVSPTCP